MRSTKHPSPLLRLRDVHKVYEQRGAPVRALDGVDLDVQRGEYIALTGSSGSGKSTLLHILGALDSPSSGSYLLDGEEIAGLSRDELARTRRRIGFVFQAFHLMPRLSAAENVALPLRYAGVAPATRIERARCMLERVGLGDRVDHRPNELSGGQQQRVAVARALVANAEILLCDEATGNLDSRSGAEIVALLEGLWRDGRTLIVVTHDATLARRAARVLEMRDGRLCRDEGP